MIRIGDSQVSMLSHCRDGDGTMAGWCELTDTPTGEAARVRQTLERRGLLERSNPVISANGYARVPWRLTEAGKTALELIEELASVWETER